MPTNLTKDEEDWIKLSAKQAQLWQSAITADEDLEKWCADGHWTYLRAKVLDQIEREYMRGIKNPAFDPSNVSHVSQFKALCQTIDLIEGKINQRVHAVQDARDKLRDLEASTPRGDEGENNGY